MALVGSSIQIDLLVVVSHSERSAWSTTFEHRSSIPSADKRQRRQMTDEDDDEDVDATE